MSHNATNHAFLAGAAQPATPQSGAAQHPRWWRSIAALLLGTTLTLTACAEMPDEAAQQHSTASATTPGDPADGDHAATDGGAADSPEAGEDTTGKDARQHTKHSADSSGTGEKPGTAQNDGRGGAASRWVGQGTPGSVEAMRGMLASLPVKGRAPKTKYARAQFGQRWKDIDRNGCDQRNDVLARDMTQVQRPRGCRVESGVLDEPYTGKIIHFTRGRNTSRAVHIDHVVALGDAWQKGAQQLSPQKREELGNDPLNLLAVDGPANMQKKAADAATWLPANKPFRCQYVAIQVQVKHKYGLWVTQAERDAISRVLQTCQDRDIALAG